MKFVVGDINPYVNFDSELSYPFDLFDLIILVRTEFMMFARLEM